MGSFIGKKENEEHKELEKEKNIDKLNVYACGNIKELDKFNKKELENENYSNQNLKYYESKHPIHNWNFNFYNQKMSEELMNDIMKYIIKEYKNNNNNNMILILLDSVKEVENNDNAIKALLEILDKNNRSYKPIILFGVKIQNEYKDEEDNFNIIGNIIDKYKYNKSILKKYIEIAFYKENNYYEVIKKINSICCYFNNISDIFTILDEIIRGGNSSYNPKRKNKIQYNATFNILVIGRPGSGKSTLINLLLNERKAREGIGTSVTKIVSKYIHQKYPITFEDTPGFEDNQQLKKMINFLNNSKYVFRNGKNKFHLVLYLINSSNERTFIGEEVDLIKFIQKEIKVPIFFVCTKSKNEEYAKDFEEVIKLNLWQNFGDETNLVENIYCCHLLNEKDGAYKRFGIDKLLKAIQNYYEKEINEKAEILLNCNECDINQTKSLFLEDLKNSKDFEKYLIEISNYIIENYENMTYEEELKKVNKKTNLEIKKIQEMLVDHLALELNGKSCGKEFCERNQQQIEKNIQKDIVEEAGIGCWGKNKYKLTFKNKTIKDENIIKSIKITREIGEKAKNNFLDDIEDFKSYLDKIINDYKNAIKSLPLLNDEIEKN